MKLGTSIAKLLPLDGWGLLPDGLVSGFQPQPISHPQHNNHLQPTLGAQPAIYLEVCMSLALC